MIRYTYIFITCIKSYKSFTKGQFSLIFIHFIIFFQRIFAFFHSTENNELDRSTSITSRPSLSLYHFLLRSISGRISTFRLLRGWQKGRVNHRLSAEKNYTNAEMSDLFIMFSDQTTPTMLLVMKNYTFCICLDKEGSH